MFFHHLTHTQAILVLNCPAVMAVAPAGCTFEKSDDLEPVRSFLLRPHDSFVLGTWYVALGPVPTGRAASRAVQRPGSCDMRRTMICANLADLGASIEVLVTK